MKRPLVPVAIVLIVLGIVSIVLQPVLDPKPDTVCAEPGTPYSGFVDDEKDDCPVTDESWAEISDWESKPKPFRIVGILLILGGVAAGAVGLLRGRRRDGTHPPDA